MSKPEAAPSGCAPQVLAPAPVKAGPTTSAADLAPQPTPPAAPVEHRPPPNGYYRAIEAHRQVARPSRIDPAISDAVQRQTATMRELSRRAFPEADVVTDGAPAPIEQARTERRRRAAATEAAALRRARAERVGTALPAAPHSWQAAGEVA
ncbi:hypothetical protein [Streptomyces halstedii]|uniref:hypothetical protein n=1 Tax=Streptomyces halstedii TaxID=1944 RepID=UPI0033596927